VRNTINWASPDLQSLVDLFFPQSESLGVFQEVTAAELPEAYQQLLAHPHHMTVANEAFHGGPVTVQVVAESRSESHYSRQILLRRSSDQRVVQYGIVRINRSQLPAEVVAEIERGDTPLGRILIEHDVMRTVKLLSLWRIVPGPYLREQFAPAALTECYGRTAFLYLNGLPVVELLEIVNVEYL